MRSGFPGSLLRCLFGPPPCLVVSVPVDCFCETDFEIDSRVPAQVAHFGRVYGVAKIVAGAILNVNDLRFVKFAQIEQHLGEFEVRDFISCTNVVYLALLATLENMVYRCAVIGNMDPVSDIGSVTV